MEDTRTGWQRYADWLDRKEETEDDEGEGAVWQVENGQWVQVTTTEQVEHAA